MLELELLESGVQSVVDDCTVNDDMLSVLELLHWRAVPIPVNHRHKNMLILVALAGVQHEQGRGVQDGLCVVAGLLPELLPGAGLQSEKAYLDIGGFGDAGRELQHVAAHGRPVYSD